ncbi:MAG TPA: hypothetical protein DCP47_05035 [Phycisphaerales bacterium]|nr:hypothetical protein [Phycisphaerales bacterium]
MTAFNAIDVPTYTITAARSALLQQVNCERPLNQPIIATQKNPSTETLVQICLEFNNIINCPFKNQKMSNKIRKPKIASLPFLRKTLLYQSCKVQNSYYTALKIILALSAA